MSVAEDVRALLPRLSEGDQTSRLLATAQLAQLLFTRGGEVIEQLATGTGVDGVELLTDLVRARAAQPPPRQPPAPRRSGWSAISTPPPALPRAGGIASLLALAGRKLALVLLLASTPALADGGLPADAGAPPDAAVADAGPPPPPLTPRQAIAQGAQSQAARDVAKCVEDVIPFFKTPKGGLVIAGIIGGGVLQAFANFALPYLLPAPKSIDQAP